MQIALYVRVSTSTQAQKQTIEQQLERLQAVVADEPSWQLRAAHIFRDDGYSGATLQRPGLQRLREEAARGAFTRVLLTAPDRLARDYVHQMLLLDELEQQGCVVDFVDRPLKRDDPNEQLLLQIRSAVAEYERSLIGERMRRGRKARLESGTLLPWQSAPYGYLPDAERPRDPSRVQLDPVAASMVQQIFAWYTDPKQPRSLAAITRQLMADGVPSPAGNPRWHRATVRHILRNSAYNGTAYANQQRRVPARRRRSPLQPLGEGMSKTATPPDEWIAVSVPPLVSADTFELAQQRMQQNKQRARRNNSRHDYLLRSLVSCGRCHLAATGRASAGYAYYVCNDRLDSTRPKVERCDAPYIPVQSLDDLVWHDLCQLLNDPTALTHQFARVQAGEWLPQQVQAQQQSLHNSLAQLDRQQQRLLDLYLAETVAKREFERKHSELSQKQLALSDQLRQLETQAQQQLDLSALAQGVTQFCQRIQETLPTLSFSQKRQLVELLIDRVVVDDHQVEIRYVFPTSPAGERQPFCYLRLTHLRRNDRLIVC